jgi:threonine/homoserine/homoserine lactone efflux protein
MLMLLVDGIIIGVIVSAPVGPVNMVTIQRTLLYGRMNGFLTALGAALGDGIFAVLAALGLVAAADLAGPNGFALQLIGGIFLIVVGGFTIRNASRDTVKTPAQAKSVALGTQGPMPRAFWMNFVLTITNPATLIGLIGIFAGVGGLIDGDLTARAGWMLAAGVAAGSALWWLTLTFLVGLFSGEMSARRIRRLNLISGAAILLFGIAIIGRLVWMAGS